jgi:hypothetical protein
MTQNNTLKEPTKEQWEQYYRWRDQARVINLTVYEWIAKYYNKKKV